MLSRITPCFGTWLVKHDLEGNIWRIKVGFLDTIFMEATIKKSYILTQNCSNSDDTFFNPLKTFITIYQNKKQHFSWNCALRHLLSTFPHTFSTFHATGRDNFLYTVRWITFPIIPTIGIQKNQEQKTVLLESKFIQAIPTNIAKSYDLNHQYMQTPGISMHGSLCHLVPLVHTCLNTKQQFKREKS